VSYRVDLRRWNPSKWRDNLQTHQFRADRSRMRLMPRVHPFNAQPGTDFANPAFEKSNSETKFHKRNREYEH